MYENATFVVFLTLILFFRRTDPIQASVAIVFSPSHAAFLTAISSHADRPERRQNATGRRTGYICTDPYPRSLSSAPQIPASPAFYAPPSSGPHTLWTSGSIWAETYGFTLFVNATPCKAATFTPFCF